MERAEIKLNSGKKFYFQSRLVTTADNANSDQVLAKTFFSSIFTRFKIFKNKKLLRFHKNLIANFLKTLSTDEEEIEKLDPNYVLYKATSAHNLPVMCQAISLGADKNYENPENLNRTPLHQSILAVSFELDGVKGKFKEVNGSERKTNK